MSNPDGMQYCKVEGRFRAFLADGTDAGSEPDFAPMSGTITFTPNITHARNTQLGAEEMYFPQAITVELDEDGDVSLNGEKGVYLLCPSEIMNPGSFNWTAAFKLKLPNGKLVRSFGPFPFDVIPGGLVDLAVALPVPAANGEWALIGPTGPAGPQGAAGAPGADSTVPGPPGPQGPAGADSTVPGPQGPVGPAGPQGIAGVGVEGPAGPAGPQGPVGPAGMTWRGAWDSAVDYELHDTVYHNGSSWFASIDPPITAEPGIGSEQWQPLAIQGPVGPAGAAGSPGAAGPQGPEGAQGPAGAPGPIVPLNDLTDVDTTGVADKMVLTYNQATGTWKAEAAAGGSGLPAGGAAYQTLVKNSSTDGDASWVRQGRFRGAWDSVAKMATYDFATEIPSIFTVTPTVTRVANPGGAGAPTQSTVVGITGQSGAGLTFTIPAGVTQIRYIWSRPWADMTKGEVLKNGIVADTMNSFQIYNWAARTLTVAPGDVIKFHKNGVDSQVYVGEVSYWGALGDPYMTGDAVGYQGSTYVSTVDSNSTTPGATGATWTRVTDGLTATTAYKPSVTDSTGGTQDTATFKVWTNASSSSTPAVWADSSGASAARVALRATMGNSFGNVFEAGIWFMNSFYNRFAINQAGNISRLGEQAFHVAAGTANPQDLAPSGNYGIASVTDRHMTYLKRNINTNPWPAWNVQPYGFFSQPVTVTANYTPDCRDSTIIANGSNITVTLPDPSSGGISGRHFVIKNIHATGLTVATAGTGKTLDGVTYRTLSQYQSAEFMTDGSQWHLLTNGIAGPTPVLRDFSTSYGASGTAVTGTVPATALAGDLLVFFAGSNYAMSTGPTGWTQAGVTNGGWHNASMYYKFCTAGDIGATVTATAAGSEQWNTAIVAVSRANSTLGNVTVAQSQSGTSLNTSSVAAAPGDLVLFFGSGRTGASNVSSSLGTLIGRRNTDTILSSAVFQYTPTAPGNLVSTMSTPGSTSGWGVGAMVIRSQ